MHSSSPDWVFGDALLISSTSTTLANTGPGPELEAPVALVEDVRADEVGGEHVRGALHPRDLCLQRGGQRSRERRLADARVVLDQHVTAGHERDQQLAGDPLGHPHPASPRWPRPSSRRPPPQLVPADRPLPSRTRCYDAGAFGGALEPAGPPGPTGRLLAMLLPPNAASRAACEPARGARLPARGRLRPRRSHAHSRGRAAGGDDHDTSAATPHAPLTAAERKRAIVAKVDVTSDRVLAEGKVHIAAGAPSDAEVKREIEAARKQGVKLPAGESVAAFEAAEGQSRIPGAEAETPLTPWNPRLKPIAAWIVPVLQWAAEHGWSGTVTSGYRSYYEQAQLNAAGAFSAPAGYSNHETDRLPRRRCRRDRAWPADHGAARLPGTPQADRRRARAGRPRALLRDRRLAVGDPAIAPSLPVACQHAELDLRQSAPSPTRARVRCGSRSSAAGSAAPTCTPATGCDQWAGPRRADRLRPLRPLRPARSSSATSSAARSPSTGRGASARSRPTGARVVALPLLRAPGGDRHHSASPSTRPGAYAEQLLVAGVADDAGPQRPGPRRRGADRADGRRPGTRSAAARSASAPWRS